ncbi:DUF805 domain-containing protein [Modestobacter roseus]|uniref:Uncharacterized membrane protein YhaH (DUF805 family) n=1 Tax=Modestobacter roseus TaxID=1181884 RepID=A0A562IUA3_9ACTN|nr:DUF805 domain-containing protein [Modestobacter roseus]TWH74255.1 uncharacterized membrane protein YhaH (DUF805 family) [Modestobacter roseus]
MSGLAAWYLPTGRIRRRDWWLRYVLPIALVGLMATSIDATWFPESYPRFESRPNQLDPVDWLWFFPAEGGPVTAVSALVLLVPNVTAMVTRLHDRDHSAWWLLWALLPGIGWLVLLVTLGFLGTDPRPNRYGPPPRRA